MSICTASPDQLSPEEEEQALRVQKKRQEINDYFQNTPLPQTRRDNEQRNAYKLLPDSSLAEFASLLANTEAQFDVDHIVRQLAFKWEVARANFVAPMVAGSVGHDIKEAFIRLTSLKHKVGMEKPNKVGSPNEQCNILLAAYNLGSLVQAQVDAEERSPVETKKFLSGLNERLHGCKPDRRGQELMVFVLNTVKALRAVGEFILLRPDILSESTIKKCTRLEYPILLKCLVHFVPPYCRTNSANTMASPDLVFFPKLPEGLVGSDSGSESTLGFNYQAVFLFLLFMIVLPHVHAKMPINIATDVYK